MSEEAGTATRAGRRPFEEAIITAAVDLFGARGFNGASMRDIAAGAGTSLSNLYNYVPGKADLLAQVLRQANDELLAHLVAAVEAAGVAPADRLQAAVRAYVLWSASRQRAGVVAMSEFRYLQGELRSQVVDARDATQRIFGEIVDDGVAAGAFRTPHPHEAARNVVLLCAALSTWFNPDGGRSAEQIADEQARLALAMVELAPGVTAAR